LRNATLDLLAAGAPNKGSQLASAQFRAANNMTDQIGALNVLALIPGDAREAALDSFFRAHASDPLVIDKWFALQAMIPEDATLARIKRLMNHHDFSLTNPNRLRSLIGAFATGNLTRFNSADGSVYDWLVETVIAVDPKNPQVAARLLAAFRSWRSSAWVGALSACGSACWFSAFALAPVALVRALGQIEMVFTLLFSRFYLHEKLKRADIQGLVLVVAGVVLVLLGR
jgi:aminopeptidase N